MLGDSDPRGEEGAAQLPSDDSGASGCDEPGVQCAGGCSPPAPALPLHGSLWAHERRHPHPGRSWATTRPKGTQAVSGTSRTLSHPSFQSLFTAAASGRAPSCPPGVGGHVSSSESGSSVGHLPLVDCSSFYYTDPTLPPGLRIYNWLSGSSQEVCRSRPLNTPAPIMAVREASPPPRRTCAVGRQLSDLERQAVSALLELPAGPHQDTPVFPGAGAGQE